MEMKLRLVIDGANLEDLKRLVLKYNTYRRALDEATHKPSTGQDKNLMNECVVSCADGVMQILDTYLGE